ncbi:MAG: hypothetical protein FIB04_07455 [Gammaproteobacteria bacterium]|nr:hypothetical protein [Gammaproteobacteria bacterium]
MRMDIDRSGCDSEAARLLPWFVSGRLDPVERARVDEHLAACPICRADREAQAQLRELMRSDDRIEYSPQPALEKLMSRIDEMDREFDSGGSTIAPRPPRVAMHAPRWLVAALVIQTVGLGVLGAALWQHFGSEPAPGQYRTLAATAEPVTGAPQLRVVFAPATTVADIAELLRPMRGTVVSGPSEAGAYAIAVAGDHARPRELDAQIERLRADRRVLFVEPIAGAPSQER